MSRVYKRNGSPYWQAEFYDLSGQRHQRSTQCTDRRAAEARLRELERDAADPARAAARTTTIRDILEAFVTQRHQDARAGRASAETSTFYAKKAGHVVRVFGEGTPVAELTAARVDAFIAQRRTEGAADSTIHKELVTLRGAARLAKRRGLWAGDIEATFPRGFSPAYVPRDRWLPPHEVTALLAELPADRAAVVAFSVATGAEWRAIERARVEDVTAEAVLLRGTKRESRHRPVPVVFPWQTELLTFALDAAVGAKGLLFRPWGNVRRDLHQACERARIEPCSPNDLRRTFGHWTRGAGLAPATVGAALGHADARMAERVYAKLDARELAAVMRREAGLRIAPSPGHCHNSVPNSADIGAPLALPAHENSGGMRGSSVPRDGIEPPTRGFSVPVVTNVIPRKHRRITGATAPVVTIVSARGPR